MFPLCADGERGAHGSERREGGGGALGAAYELRTTDVYCMAPGAAHMTPQNDVRTPSQYISKDPSGEAN